MLRILESVALTDPVIKSIFLLLGIGLLVPWNAFVSSKPYFESRFCSTSIADDETPQKTLDVELLFSLVYNISSVVSLGIVIFIGWMSARRNKRGGPQIQQQRHPFVSAAGRQSISEKTNNQGHTFQLVMIPLFIYFIAFVCTAIMVAIKDIPDKIFQGITMICLAACGTSQALAQAGIVAEAGFFPSNVGINSFISGQAVGGVAVTVANFIAAAIFGKAKTFWDDQCSASSGTATTATTATAATTATTATTMTLEAHGSYLDADHIMTSSSSAAVGFPSEASCVPYKSFDVAVFIYFILGAILLALCMLGFYCIHALPRVEEANGYEPVNNISEEIILQNVGGELVDSGVIPEESEGFGGESNGTDLHIQQKDETGLSAVIRGPALSIFLTFAVTLSLFPVWTSELRSVQRCKAHLRLSNDLFVPFTFLLYNVGDLVGRMMTEHIPVKKITKLSSKLVIASLVRIVFFPLFLLCVGGVNGVDRRVIPSDVYSVIVQFAFGVTNGLLISTSFMVAPGLLTNDLEIHERSGEILSFAVSFGLLSGSLVSLPFSEFTSKF